MTTNTQDYINKILEVSNLQDIYNGIIASKTNEEPDKKELINKLFKKYGKPEYYLTGKQEEKITQTFNELGIKVITKEEMDNIYF